MSIPVFPAFNGGYINQTVFAFFSPEGTSASVPRVRYPEAESETGFWRRVFRKRKLGNRREVTVFGKFVFRYGSRGKSS